MTTEDLLSAVLASDNLARAWKRVKSNKGAPGIDGVTVQDWPEHARAHWPALREQIKGGRYRPQAVRRVEIPKPDGGKRLLGIPTVTDRVVQQAIAQVLTPIFDPTFSDSSFGFRPGRNAHQASQVGCVAAFHVFPSLWRSMNACLIADHQPSGWQCSPLCASGLGPQP